MDADWIRSPGGRRVVELWHDARPAWLWSQDGQTLIWRNRAARLFLGKVKRKGLKLVPELTPIRGQVARIIRLGSMGRSSLSRIQFLAGEKPVSVTCSCTPLTLPGGPAALLIAGVDPIEKELWFADPGEDELSRAILPEGAEYLIAAADGVVVGGSREALRQMAPGLDAATADGEVQIEDKCFRVTRLRASPDGAELVLFEAVEARQDTEQTGGAEPPPPTPLLKSLHSDARERDPGGDGIEVAPPAYHEHDIPEEAARAEDFLTAGWFEDDVAVATDSRRRGIPLPVASPEVATTEPLLENEPVPLPPQETIVANEPALELREAAISSSAAATIAETDRRLSSLFDRLVGDGQLFAPLGEADDHPPEAGRSGRG